SQAAVGELLDARAVRLQVAVEVEPGLLARGQLARVARGQEVDAVVVGVEELGGVKAGGGRCAPAARRSRLTGAARAGAPGRRTRSPLTGSPCAEHGETRPRRRSGRAR